MARAHDAIRLATQSLIYANGPNAGQLFTDPYVSASASVHTNMNHMDHIANDLSGTFKTDMGAAKIDLKLGYLYYSQRIAEDWHSNNSINEARGSTPAELDLISGPALLADGGNLLCAGGQCGFNGGWNQQFDMTFTNNAPVCRHELGYRQTEPRRQRPRGVLPGLRLCAGQLGPRDWQCLGGANRSRLGHCGQPGGTQVTTLVPLLGYDGPIEAINFSERATNWSFGALYKFTPDLSVFARASHGTRFNADRLTSSTPSYFNPEGSLSVSGLANAAFPVKQYELGLKSRGGLFGGHYTVELTAFYSTYSISSQEIIG